MKTGDENEKAVLTAYCETSSLPVRVPWHLPVAHRQEELPILFLKTRLGAAFKTRISPVTLALTMLLIGTFQKALP